MKIAIGNDHTSVAMKKHIVDYLTAKGYELVNFGTDSEERVDYPIYGKKVADAVASGECELGILICGTGIGMYFYTDIAIIHGCDISAYVYSTMLEKAHSEMITGTENGCHFVTDSLNFSLCPIKGIVVCVPLIRIIVKFSIITSNG